jgi:hypothetical protein
MKSIVKNIYLDQEVYPKYRWLINYLIACKCFYTEGLTEECDKLYKQLINY